MKRASPVQLRQALEVANVTEFVEVKTQDLSGAALDWAVAIAEGYEPDRPQDGQLRMKWLQVWIYVVAGKNPHVNPSNWYSPSSDWSHGGPLIQKYKLDIGAPLENQNGPWNAATEWAHPMGYKGDTPLIAACRAIVASSLGDTVSVPKELV